MAVAPEVAKEIMDANTVTTIINNLNSLYSGAMSQVITYTAIIIGVVGILIPALSILFQWRSLKAEKKSLEKDIQEGINNAKASIRADLIAELKEQVSIEEAKLTSNMELKFKILDEGIDRSTASIFFLQGKIQLNAGNYAGACVDYCVASRRFLTGNDYINGQRALDTAIDNCLKEINQQEYEGAVEKEIETLIQFLESDDINIHKQFHDKIELLKEESKKAKLRELAKEN